MKILNLYAGIGGNRKLWGDEHEITAVEWDEQRAAVYADLFPHDTVIVGDAHQYLLDHYKEFGFIWSSPPCPSHSKIRNEALVGSGKAAAIYPDMKLWQEIIFLQHFAPGLYCVENVDPYYKVFIPAQKVDRHLFWTNFIIASYKPRKTVDMGNSAIGNLKASLGMDDLKLTRMDTYRKRQTLRNCVHPTLGKHILDCALGVQAQPLLIPYKQEALI